MNQFFRGKLVWGKITSYPWWPAIVLDPDDCGRDENFKSYLWLFWFGDHKISELNMKKIVDFEECYTKYFLKKSGKKYLQAVEEALIILSERYKVNLNSSVFQWAARGFKNSLASQKNFTNDLPNLVLESLNNNNFKRKCEASVECDEIDTLVSDIFKGKKDLEDICISCCKITAMPVVKHPFFIGGVCYICKKHVEKICKLPFGYCKDMCIICGQGGNLVYCCNTTCLCSFCQLCIEYFTPKDSFSKILKDDNWFCYICKSVPSSKCLIKTRSKFKLRSKSVNFTPERKLPIRVIADSNEVLDILKSKQFAVEKYCISPPDVHLLNDKSNTLNYSDFTTEEFFEISADLICGSYFIDKTSSQCRIENIESFFISFYRFLFRLNIARLVKPLLFFIFASSGEILDERVQSRVIRFLEVESISIKSKEKVFVLWTNIPKCSLISNFKLSKNRKSKTETAENCIYSYFIEQLKNYFTLHSEK